MSVISCIVPVYNAERYIGQCVDSIVAQSFGDWELILVDDGSTDGSGAVCDRYAELDPRISVIHTANAGVSVARNIGIEAAQSKYIAFVDADDMIHPDYFKTLYDTMLTSGASVVACDMQQGAQPKWYDVNTPKQTVYSPREAIIDTLYQHRLNCSCSGKLFLTVDIRRAGGFVPGLRFEDLEAFHRFYMATSGPVVHIAAPLYFYRTNPDGYINNMGQGRLDVLHVTEDIERRYADDPEIARAAADRRFSANYNIMLLCLRHGLDDQARQCWQLVRSRRWAILTNPHVRLKNRLGALAALLGYPFIKLLS